MSPTSRSKKHLEDRGYQVAIVEYYNHHVRRKFDLYGFADLLGVKEGKTIAVQTTTSDNLAARLKKMGGNTVLPVCKQAGWKIEAHGWGLRGKAGKRKLWKLKVVEL